MRFLISAVTASYAVFFFYAQSIAAPTGGTDPRLDGSLLAISAGYDYFADRDLKSPDIEKGQLKKSDTGYVKLIYRPIDFLSVYAKAGLTKFETDVHMAGGIQLREEYQFAFYTGGGLRLTHEFANNIKIAADGQITWSKADMEEISYNGVGSTYAEGDTTVWEYQASGILGYTIDYRSIANPAINEHAFFTPYIGITYAHLETDSNAKGTVGGATVTAPTKYGNKDRIGLVCGVDFTVPLIDRCIFNIEGRLADGLGVSGSLNYNF